MKINELVKTGEREEQYEVVIPAYYDPQKKVKVEARTVTKTRIVPIMESLTREMTEEEERQFKEDIFREEEPPTNEERLAALEAAMLEQILGGNTNV